MKWVVPFLCIFVAAGCHKDQSPQADYNKFDQRPGMGWRQLAEKGRYSDAAKLIDKYIEEHKYLDVSQKANLQFHAGQMYAFANDHKTAIERFQKSTYAEEPPELPLRWNAYVQATIVFLSKDLKRLKECREEIAEGPTFQGEKANLDIVVGLIEHFDEPYSKAYGARGNQRPQPPPVSDKWLEILDREVKARGGRIPIDPQISVVVDREGSGKEYFEPSTEREKDYGEAFIKLRSLATSLYRTEEGRAAYLELFNPDFLIRLADRLDFDLSYDRRVNLRDRKFVPRDFPVLLEYIHHNMTYVLNLEPDFTKTFNAFSSEDDTKNYDPIPGKNGLFKMVNGQSNGQTVRVNLSEKLGQMSLLATWLIEGNPERGIPALGIRHPIVVGLLVYHMGGMEHDSTHALQYFFNPVDYLNRLVEKEQPEVMDPKSKGYGLINKQLIQKARFKLFYEMDGFYISGFFRRGHEQETLAAADLIDDLRSRRDVIRGLPGAEKWVGRIQPYFDKGWLLEWLQDGTNRRDVVTVYLRGDGSDPGHNLWFLDDERVFPDSMRAFMFTQFDPAEAVAELATINLNLEKGENLSKAQIDKLTQDSQAVAQVWKATVEVLRANGGLESMFKEYPYLKAVVARYEGDPARGIEGEIRKFERLARMRGIQGLPPMPQPKPQSGQPSVELNHVYVTLQKDTIDSIAKSAFISEQFSMFEQETIKTVTESWTGTYLMGWRAYLELFAPGGHEGLREGSSGIGFSVSRLGSGGAIKAKLDSLVDEKTLSDLSKMVKGNDSIPWFDNIRLQSLDKGAFSTWLMDFRTDYLKYRKIELTKDGLFDRHSYNAYGYTTLDKKKSFESKLFDDLLEVHLELSASESASFDKFVTALGYSASEDRGKRSYRAGNFTFFVSTLPNPGYRIRKVVCTLRRAVEPSGEYKFGQDARLVVEGRTAVWIFGRD